ncbi:MAG TPA: secretin and TonB N-terminal domain-containing protein [Abditibacteriaceae bacterium]
MQSQAADAINAITPASSSQQNVAASAFTLPADSAVPSPASIAAPPLPTGPVLISIDFADAPVAEVVSMIAKQGNVNIMVNQDVDNRVKNLSLNNVTVDEAIRAVVQGSQLSLTKIDNTYVISKALPSSVAALVPAQTPSSTPSNPFGTLPGIGILPQNVPIPSLVAPTRSNDQDEERTFEALTLRNVKPSMMAYWLDPANHPMPAEFQQSQDRLENPSAEIIPRQQDSSRNRRNRNGLGNSDNFEGYGGYGQFNNNPYSPYNPYMQANPQFGGGGGRGGGNQGGGRGGGNQGGGRGGGGGGRGGGGGGGGGGLGSAQGLIALPPGVESMTAIDPQNALLVRGTEEGIDQIRNVISYLDRPIGQVEIEAQFVSVSRTDIDRFQIGFRGARGNTDIGGGNLDPTTGVQTGTGGISVDVVRGNYRLLLNALIQRGTGRLESSPRITTFNNLTARIVSTRNQPVIITESDITPGTGGAPPTITTTQTILTFTTGTILTVTPTINQDGTITIAMQPLVSDANDGIAVPGPNSSGVIPIITQQQIDTLANVKDGETLAIGGLRQKNIRNVRGRIPILGSIPLIGRLFRTNDQTEFDSELIIFVTARIVRRINDPVPGT